MVVGGAPDRDERVGDDADLVVRQPVGERPDVADEPLRIARPDRGERGAGGVADRLRPGAAHADDDDGAELGIADEAAEDLRPAADLLADEHRAADPLGGRGGAIGPELTGIVARAGRGRVVESLLDPHREIAPAFQTYAVTLRDGRVVSGLSAGLADGDRAERIVGSDGRETVVPLAEVESRVPLATSVMPSGLEQGLSDADLRDLLALLAE